MPTYVTLFKLTDHGIRNIKDTVKGTDARHLGARAGIKTMNCILKKLMWLAGACSLSWPRGRCERRLILLAIGLTNFLGI